MARRTGGSNVKRIELDDSGMFALFVACLYVFLALAIAWAVFT
jgi:hypothetical protein